MDKAKQIQLIQIGRKQLCLDEDVYRAILMRLTNKNSLRLMSSKQLNVVLDDIKRLGFKVKSKQGSQPKQVKTLRPQLELIRSLWADLAKNKIVRDASDKALNKFIKRMVKVDALQWLNEQSASLVIEHLKQWLSRVKGDCDGKGKQQVI